MWIEEYKMCGCSSEAKDKRKLLGYCSLHGNTFARRFRVPEYHRAQIIKCSDKDFWYAHKIGDIILVKNLENSAYVEAKNGSSLLRNDLSEEF
jgi:hypothetical protein